MQDPTQQIKQNSPAEISNQLSPTQQGLTQTASSNIAESQPKSSATNLIYLDIKNKYALKPIILSLFNVVSFVCNFYYATENSVITMMMITFLTPNIVDSLIWIIPNIIAIIIRPYLIRYVQKHQKGLRIRKQATMISAFLVVATIGAFLVAQSGLMNDSKKGFFAMRVLICSIGWTLTGLSFQLIEYFAQKLKQSLQRQCYIKNTIKTGSTQATDEYIIINFEEQQKSQTLLQNYRLTGVILGYLIVIVMFAFPFKNQMKMKSFFQLSSMSYSIMGFLSLISCIVSYFIITFSGLPKPDPQNKSKSIPFKISFSANYYLPGLSELRCQSLQGLSFLAIHFMVIFITDVMFIYTTMWTQGSIQTENMKQSEANFYGMKNGVFYLIVWNIVYYGNILPDFGKRTVLTFNFTLIVTSVLFFVSFITGKSISFLPLLIVIAVFYKIYEDSIEPLLEEIEPQIKQSKEVVIRIEKVAVLNVMPFTAMILLGRDDIQDCMLWCGVMLLVMVVILMKSQLNLEKSEETKTDQTKEKKQ